MSDDDQSKARRLAEMYGMGEQVVKVSGLSDNRLNKTYRLVKKPSFTSTEFISAMTNMASSARPVLTINPIRLAILRHYR